MPGLRSGAHLQGDDCRGYEVSIIDSEKLDLLLDIAGAAITWRKADGALSELANGMPSSDLIRAIIRRFTFCRHVPAVLRSWYDRQGAAARAALSGDEYGKRRECYTSHRTSQIWYDTANGSA